MADVNTALIDSYLQTLWDRKAPTCCSSPARRR